MNKNIRSKVVKESLLDYNALAESMRENTTSAVKSLLGEAVRETYAKLLSEDDDKDYDVEEVEDTDADINSDDAVTADTSVEDGSADQGTDTDETTPTENEPTEGEETDITVTSDDPTEGEGEREGEIGDEGDEWAEFDKYKVSDDEYDFSNAEDEEIVKVYKLMKNDDQILVHKDDSGNVNIQDNETGAEYLINLGDGTPSATADADNGFSAEDDFENANNDDMNESTERLFELVLEYDSNVGYTDNYQNKDVMTNNGMTEPSKSGRDWDKGVPKGTSKPWSGKKDKTNAPFTAEKGKQLEEGDNVEEPMEEATNVGGFVQQNSTSKSHVPNSNGRQARSMSKGSKRVKGTATPRYSSASEETVSEGIMKKVNAALDENKALKGTLTEMLSSLKQAAVTNHNLCSMIKLYSENSTTQEEKNEILERFKKTKTIDESKALYETISDELKKAPKMSISENKNLSVEGSQKINETKIYQSQDLLSSLDLMHRMMR